MVRTAQTRTASGDSKLGRRLEKLRVERGLAKNELAARASIDPSTLTRIESGERGASRTVLDRLVAALDLSPAEYSDLLTDAGLLSHEAAKLVEHPELAQLTALLSDPRLTVEHRNTLLQYVTLAVRHGLALGYAGRARPDNGERQ